MAIKNGNSRNNNISGTNGNDVIRGYGGDDVLSGGGGQDSLYGGGGNDDLRGGAGNDDLYGGASNDLLNGGVGNDLLDGGAGADRMTGGAGDDSFYVDNANDRTIENAGEGRDSVFANITWTLAANTEVLEFVRAAGNNAILEGRGNGGENTLRGTEGIEYLYGGANIDSLHGLGGNDHLYGEDGKDYLYGGLGNDLIEGGEGGDVLQGNEGQDVLRGGAGDDYLSGFDRSGGPEESDELWGGEGDDDLYGRLGDILRGGVGNDTYSGNNGVVIVENAGEGTDLVVTDSFDMANAPNVENMIVSGDGTGFGNDLDNIIRGPYDGSDGRRLTLDGRGGDDHLVGNAFSPNTYTGGSGSDTFYLTTTWDDSEEERETVLDFEGGIDRIGFERDVDAPTQFITAAMFHSGSGADAVAQTAAHRYIYNEDTSMLYYDQDGSGAAAMRVLMEIHMTSGALSHGDFYYMPDVPYLEFG